MVAGMRTFTAPAAAYRRKDTDHAETSSDAIAGALTALAALEMIADKRTAIPRVRPGALAARIAEDLLAIGAAGFYSSRREGEPKR